MFTPFDALVDAIVNSSGYRVPGSPTHKARNPGGLKAFGVKTRDVDNYRVFKSDIDGLQALKFDVQLKITGKSRVKCETLADLAVAYNAPIKSWVAFLKQALGDQTLSAKSPLTIFTEK